jgi:transcriptional regulator with XRE-family HTH domain
MGAAIKQIREEQELTQKQVGDKYGTTEGNIAAYEQGRNRFTAQDIPRLAAALGVPTPYLSRRLGLCGDASDLNAILLEFAGPDIAPLIASALARYPDLDGRRRDFFIHALQSL